MAQLCLLCMAEVPGSNPNTDLPIHYFLHLQLIKVFHCLCMFTQIPSQLSAPFEHTFPEFSKILETFQWFVLL